MSATLTSCPALTDEPESVRLPAAGTLEIFTAASAFAAASFGSVKPKSAATKVCDASSSIVSVRFAPAGASFTDVTPTLNVFAEVSRSTPPPAVPPSSCTWKVKLA